jgi:hypothetical protein
MGSWNGTCAISNLHITCGTDVAVFMLLQNHNHKAFCYINALYDICPVPFYGKYNDYGAVEDCTGFGLNIVVDAIRDQLYEFGEGPNSSHDCAVNKATFNLELLFEADLEDRLGVQHLSSWDDDSYDLRELENRRHENVPLSNSQQFELNRLASKIKQEDTFRRVTHVIIHGDVFKSIMEKWYIDDYAGTGKGTSGYENSYTRIFFKDLESSIPEYVLRKQAKKKAITEEAAARGNNPMSPATYSLLYREEWTPDEPCLAVKWSRSFSPGQSNAFGLIDVEEYVQKYTDNDDWSGLKSFTKEVLTVAWINEFMSQNRKIWTRQSSSGGQGSEALGHALLADTILEIIKAEQDEYDIEE